jgi:ArsR family transcriptional regulator, arsenate/arsenite/antimonite-responsive transcriptional repressor
MSKSHGLPLTDISACAYAPMVRQPLSADAACDVAAKLKALADPIRLRLFSLVASHAGGEACVCDISADFDVTQPTISHHLKVLKDAGLLASERRASWVYYSVVPEALRNLSAVLSVATDDDARTGAWA